MTELDLYKFIKEWSVDYSWFIKDGFQDVCLELCHSSLEDFCTLISDFIDDQDGGFEIIITTCSIPVDMKEICEWYNINMEKVFEKTDKDKRMLGEL